MADTEISTSQILSETPQASSGASGEVAHPQNEGTVSYDTHRKLLGEKKKLAERLEQLETQAKLKQEEDLKAQNQYKSLYESAIKEREDLSKKISSQETRWNNAIKLDAFMSSLGGKKIEPKYAGFINLENILMDPETGSIDSLSVQREVERVCKEYPEIVRGQVQQRPVPNEPPQNPLISSPNQSMSKEERLKQAAQFLSKLR